MSKTEDKTIYVISEFVNGEWGGICPEAYTDLKEALEDLSAMRDVNPKYTHEIHKCLILGA